MNRSIVLIHQYGGYTHETAGLVMGFFNDPVQAHDCAAQIAGAAVRGSHLIIPAHLANRAEEPGVAIELTANGHSA